MKVKGIPSRLVAPAVVTTALLLLSVTTALAAGPFFRFTFDGAPAAPTPFSAASWDVVVHSDSNAYNTMAAGHGSDCGAPPAAHTASTYADGVFICRDHVMTAVRGDSYGAVYLTPNQLADFSSGEVVIKFDVSTLRTSDRDWIDLWVSPFGDNLILPLDQANGSVDLRGEPRNAVNVRMSNCGASLPCSFFGAQVTRNFVTTDLPGIDKGYESVVTPSAAVRSTFELHLSRTHVKFGMPVQNLWWIDTDITDLGWSQGVVQLGHHSYAPGKGCLPAGDVANSCANTWHWNNVSISSAVPFTILHGNTTEGVGRTVLFPPAPASSFLRFAARGLTSPRVSFNGGPSQPARVQPSVLNQPPADDNSYHDTSYWMPVPVGTTSVTFTGSPQTGTGQPMLIHDPTIWSLSGSGLTEPPPAPAPAPAPAPGPGPSGPALPASGFHSAWVGQSAYPVVAPGGEADVTVRFRNGGSAAWIKGSVGQQANLGIFGDDQSLAVLGIDWPSPNRPAAQAESVVAPGAIGTFTFKVRAPLQRGSTTIRLVPVIDGVTWMEDEGVFVVLTSAATYHSAWVSQSAYPTLKVGDASSPITIQFRNTGTMSWVRGTPGQQANLGIVGDDRSFADLGIGWPTADRVAVQQEVVVAPGAVGTFTFQVRAPVLPGTYTLALRPVVDGLTWMEDEGVFVQVNVIP